MNKIIFFDTETTGNMEDDVLCQLAYKSEGASGETFAELYNPGKKIPPEASAVHHITNKMVADKPAFRESTDYAKIKKLFEDDDTVVVAHNAPFDIDILKKEGIEPKRAIDTLRVVRYVDGEGKMDRYNLQYLRYLLEFEVEAAAHDAMGDVIVLELLFEYLKIELEKTESLGEKEVIAKMLEISSRSSLLRTFNFGKHNGKRIEEVAGTDRGYLEWLLAQKEQSGQPEEDWIYTLRHYLGK